MRYLFWSILGMILFVQLIAYLLWRLVLRSPNRHQNDDHSVPDDEQTRPIAASIHALIDTLNQIPYERVQIVSKDGKKLSGRYYHWTDGAPVVICVHGYRGTPSRDFSGGTQLYRDAGCNLLLIEHRAHGTSEGNTITMGILERVDCRCWIQYVIDRCGPDVKILLAGISMGAATVLLTAGAGVPANVRGVIADSPYSSPKEILMHTIRGRHLPAHLTFGLLVYGAWLYGGINLLDQTANVAHAARAAKVPILLIHGEDDRFVPCEMGRAIAAANPTWIEFHTFPDAGHGLSFLVDRERYSQLIRSFTARVLADA